MKRLKSEGSAESGSESGSDEGSSENDDVGLRPVCMPSPGLAYSNYNAVVAGWGTTQEGGSVSNTLQEVSNTYDQIHASNVGSLQKLREKSYLMVISTRSRSLLSLCA